MGYRPTQPTGPGELVKQVEVKARGRKVRCGGCGRWVATSIIQRSLFGECPPCENDRMQDAWSG